MLHSVVRSSNRLLVGACAVLFLAAIGILVPAHGVYAIAAAAAVLLGGLTFYDPALIPVLAMPVLIVSMRVGGQSTNLSAADAALFAAFWVALLFAKRPFAPQLRVLLWLSAIYQVSTVFTVFANPYQQNTVEWFHAWLLVGGAVIVGWAIGISGRSSPALALFVLACSLIAVNACVLSLMQLADGHFNPVDPTWPVHSSKNFSGPLLSWAALIGFVRPAWLRWPRWFSMSVFYLCTLGTVATQSRQALVGLIAGMIIVVLRPGQVRRLARRIMLLSMIPVGFYLYTVISFDLSGQDKFNSVALRVPGLDGGLEIWQNQPLFGAGLRWWIAKPTLPGFQPPNADIEVLSSAGAIGFIGFVILLVGALVVTWRLPALYGTLAFAILVARIVQSQFDQFWVSSMVSTPFVIVGICVGAAAFAERRSKATVGPEEPRLAAVGGGT